MDTQHLNTPSWMEPLRQVVSEHHDEADSRWMLQLAPLILRPSGDSGTTVSVNSLYGSLNSAWKFLAIRAPQQTKVRVYNPDPIRDGWRCNHSVVEILMDDMPFLVASCVTELMRQGVRIYRQTYPIFDVLRDEDGAFRGFCEPDEPGALLETLIRLEIDHQLYEESLTGLEQSLQAVLQDVRFVVADWQPMLNRVYEAANWCEGNESCRDSEDSRESVELLRWLADEAFLFIGFRYYSAEKNAQGLYRLHYEPGSGLGCFREPISEAQQTIELDEHLSRQLESPGLLVLTKSSTRSTIRQDSHFDYVGVKKLDESGAVLGEWRFFGLYASKAYDTPITQIPLIRRHVRKLLELSHLPSNTHGYKALRHLIWTYPREELLQARFEQLHETIFGMLECVERRQLGIFLRPDTYGRYINVMMLIPRDQYNTDVRVRVQELLLRQLQGHSSDFGVHLSEQPLALIQFTIHCHNAHRLAVDRVQLQRLVADTVESWHDKLQQALQMALGEAEGNRLFARFGSQLPAAYREDHRPEAAVADLQILDRLDAPLTTQLYRPSPEGPLRFKVLGRGRPLALSDVLPILEHLGVRVLDATPYPVAANGDSSFWILDFGLSSESELDLNRSQLRTQFQETFIRTYYGELEDDRFNQLVLRAGISYREITLLRALCKYLLQLGLPFSQHYIEQAMSRNPDICRQLLALFAARFDPEAAPGSRALSQLLGDDILAALERVDNLDEDRILRHYLGVIRAMLRTNYYQTDDGREKGYLSFKLNTRALPFAPEPRPAFEIFVYAPWVEGVHLRAGPIARGGLRWSDRREDFRTEVLGLVKAQMVKNAVIVPVGAKGGFVPKHLPEGGDRNAVQAEVIRCYETFIRGLLDITDNRVGADIVPPPRVVRHDGDDPYLVVAADKGTATFSDIANRISGEYGFWLGDAFASGGSNGYDHKKMGITARGAWESVKRLFREQNRDCQREDFTVIGIGDMAGDVFGNGMLLSRHIRLVAAFNHQHIFIDPTPDAAITWQERKRLFELPRSSWEDYDQSLISAGGGIYKRSAKHIDLSPEARAALGTEQTRFTPNELIRAILKAPVDLLWNGGIGTYVKASTESHDQVGDRSNDNLRVDASELRVKVIGEGGNLGLTQRSRIEFARAGGRINTDAIDNAGGVDSSDHEVNLKILLNQQVAAGALSEADRNVLLESMTEEVAQLVLRHNYGQSQILSTGMLVISLRIHDHRRLMLELEKAGRLDRELECLPSEEQCAELARSGQGLTRPEIAVLLAYSKLWLCDQLVAAGIGEDPDLATELYGYFPAPVRERFGDNLQRHPLHAEILATHLTNLLCNRMGSTFISYVMGEVHCNALEAVRAWHLARDLLDVTSLWRQLEDCETAIDDTLFRQQLLHIHAQLERIVLWLLHRHGNQIATARLRERYGHHIPEMTATLKAFREPSEQQACDQESRELQAAGLPAALAERLATLRELSKGLEIIELAQDSGQDSETARRVYFDVEHYLELGPLRRQIAALPKQDLWQRKARSALARDVDSALTHACLAVIGGLCEGETLDDRLASWKAASAPVLAQLRKLYSEIQAHEQPDLPMLSVAVRELNNLQHL